MDSLTAADILTSPVLTVPEDWPVQRLARLLVDNGVSGVPVTSKAGEVVGVVSMTDIVRHGTLPARHDDPPGTPEYFVGGVAAEYLREMDGFDVEDPLTVGELMTPMLFEVPETATVQEIADMMVRGGIHRVLVTSRRKLVGIVSALDILKVVRDL